jgi:hypothetical protein
VDLSRTRVRLPPPPPFIRIRETAERAVLARFGSFGAAL